MSEGANYSRRDPSQQDRHERANPAPGNPERPHNGHWRGDDSDGHRAWPARGAAGRTALPVVRTFDPRTRLPRLHVLLDAVRFVG